MNESIFNTITALIGVDGSLTEQPRFWENEFILEDGSTETSAPGELDGFTVYFNGYEFGPNQTAAQNLLTEALSNLVCGYRESARAKLRAFGRAGRMLPATDMFLEALRNLRGNIDPASLERFARAVLTEGTYTEEVKAGLCIVESFAEQGVFILEKEVRTLSLCDEFALPCIRIAERRHDSDAVLEEMGRHASVWGHIHLAEWVGRPHAADLPEDLAELFCPDLSLDWSA